MGVYTPSLTSTALANMDLTHDVPSQEDLIKKVAVTCYGGQGTTLLM